MSNARAYYSTITATKYKHNRNKKAVLSQGGPRDGAVNFDTYFSARVTFRPLKVIQGHRCWYQLKARMRLPISNNKQNA